MCWLGLVAQSELVLGAAGLACSLMAPRSLRGGGSVPPGRHWPRAPRLPELAVRAGRPTAAPSEGDLGDLGQLEAFGCDDSGCAVDLGDLKEPFAPGELLREDPSSEFASTEPAELRSFLTQPGAFRYQLAEVTAEGRVRSLTLPRGELLAATRLRPRDLRAVAVPPPPGADVGPVLAARRGTLLLGLGDVRAIVEPRRALIFGRSTPDLTRFLRVLGNQRRAAPESGFRMLFVESALLALSRKLGSRLLAIRRATESKLRALPVFSDLEEVRQQRRSLVRCASQASAVSSALLSRLDSDDLAPLAAAGEWDGDGASEWETMLEVYLQAYNEISRECTGLLSDIEDFEGSVSLMLQERRLRVEQFELSLVIASVSITASGLLPGTMGMNLLSGYETSDRAFGVAVAAMLCICGSIFVTLWGLAAQRGFLS